MTDDLWQEYNDCNGDERYHRTSTRCDDLLLEVQQWKNSTGSSINYKLHHTISGSVYPITTIQ